MTGSDSELELNRQIRDYETKIEKAQEAIRRSEEIAEDRAGKIQESEEILRNNKKTEDMLKDLKRAERDVEY